MRTSNRWISLVAALVLIAPVGAAAQSAGSANQPPGSVDFGLRFTDLSGDAARFQRFRDIGDGAFLERVRFEREGDGWRFEAGADHAGRRDQRYVAEYRANGKIKVGFEWDQIPLFVSRDTRTLYSVEAPGVLRIADTVQQGIESGRLRLADVVGESGFFATRSRRNVAALNLVYTPSRNVDVTFDLKQTRREGTMPWGAAFGFSNAVEVAAPIDTRTTDMRAGVEWANQRGMFRVGYDGSWFDNQIPTLRWDNPLKFTDSTFATAYSTGTGTSQGRAALWPSSTMHGISTAGSLKLPAQSRFTGNIAFGTWLQDEPLLPFTINSAIEPIPLERQTAEAKARTLVMNYNLTSRPSRYVWLNARFRYYDFDNRTPEFHVDRYVRLDQAAATLPIEGTEPLGYTRHNLDLDASFTPIPFTAVKVGYGRDWTDRTFRVFARTTEDVFRASIDATQVGWITVRGIFEHSSRSGSRLNEHALVEIGEQPELRHFDISDRNRNRVTALVQLTPLQALGFSVSLSAGKDDYENSGFGLRDNRNRAYTFTVDLVPRDEIVAGFSYANEKYSAFQNSRNASPGPQFIDPTRNWSIDSADKVHTIGGSLDLLKAIPKTEVRLTYDFSRSKAAYVYGVPPGSTLAALQQLPPVLNELQTGTTDVRYFLTERFAIGAVYWYDRYRVDDFALGPATLDRLDLPGSLFLGYVYRPYTAHSAWLRLMYFW